MNRENNFINSLKEMKKFLEVTTFEAAGFKTEEAFNKSKKRFNEFYQVFEKVKKTINFEDDGSEIVDKICEKNNLQKWSIKLETKSGVIIRD